MTTIIMLPAPVPAPTPAQGPTQTAAAGTDGQGRSGSGREFASVFDAATAPTATILPFARGGADAATAPTATILPFARGGAGAAVTATTGTTGTTGATGSADGAVLPVPLTQPAPPAVAPAGRVGTAAALGTEPTANAVPTVPTLPTGPDAAASDVPTDDNGRKGAELDGALAEVVDLMAARAAPGTLPGALMTQAPLQVAGTTTASATTASATTASATTEATATETGVGPIGAAEPGALPATTRHLDPDAAPTTTSSAGDTQAPGAATVDSARPTPSTAAPAATPDLSVPGVVGVRVPTQVATAAVNASEALPPAAPALGPQVAEQLRAKVPGLRAAGVGQHILTLRVEPESIGPVRVVAHISTEGVRVELLGGTEAARDALRAALPDLRRDLAGSGLTDLGLGPDGGGSGHDDAPTRRTPSERPVPEAGEATVPLPDTGSARSRSRLDLLV